MERLKLDVLSLCETRWSGEDHFASGDKLVISSSSPDGGYGGVAVVLSTAVKNSLLSYTPVSNRLLVVRIQATPVPITIIQVYAPTSSCSAEEIDDFYEKLQAVIDAMKSRQVCVVMGDFNAKLGLGRDFESGVWDYGLGQRNERGDMLAEFCRINGLVVCNTAFQHNLRSRYTWISPDGCTRNLIDYVMISKSWFSSVLDSRARPGAECDTGHHLVTLK